VYNLASRLDRDKFVSQVIALRGGAVRDWMVRAGIDVSVLGVRNRFDLPRLKDLVGILRRSRVDILHTHLFHADLAGRLGAYLSAVPHLVHTVHTAEGRFRPWQFAFARMFADGCDRIICVSESAKAFHARRSGLPDRRYSVIPNGVDLEYLRRDEQVRQTTRRQWGLDESTPLAAYLGRLDYEKGLDTLLSAMAHLAGRGRAMHLVIAGDGPGRGQIENFIAHNEGGKFCRFLGFVEDIRPVLWSADLLVMPSRWEGFGLSAAEAMAGALAVVAARVPGLSDVVVHEQTGLLVEPGNAVELAEAMVALAGDAERRNRFARAGRERAEQYFEIGRMICSHERLYEAICAISLGKANLV